MSDGRPQEAGVYTQTELRRALTHSAERADTIVDDDLEALLAELAADATPGTRTRPARLRRPRPAIVPFAAAATVLAIAVCAVLLARAVGTGGHGHRAATAPPTPTGPPTSVSTRPPPNARSSVDTNFPTTLPAHTRAGLAGVSDLVAAGPDVDGVDYELAGDSSGGTLESLSRQTGPSTMVVVYVVARTSGFDAHRVPRDRPVRVGDRTGYYSHFQLLPLVGTQNSAKYSPSWTLAIPVGGGTWAFAELDRTTSTGSGDDSVDDPTAVAAAFSDLRLEFGGGRMRSVPLRTGYLPHGMQVGALEVRTGSDLFTDVGFYRGSTESIDITVAPASQQRSHVRCPGCDGTTVVRTSDGMRITVNSFTYSRAVLARIARSIVATADPAHWWTVRGAFG